MTSSVKPEWLGAAVRAVMHRLEGQRSALRNSRSSAALEQIAALYKRQARCWRVLANHVDEPIVFKAMLHAEAHCNNSAWNYREMADIRRTSEQWAEARASYTGVA
ncbi:hypothetical protein ACWEV3_10955 [Saccharopolyspora sp. NPDC003752]